MSHNALTDLPVLYHAQELHYLRVNNNRIKQFSQCVVGSPFFVFCSDLSRGLQMDIWGQVEALADAHVCARAAHQWLVHTQSNLACDGPVLSRLSVVADNEIGPGLPDDIEHCVAMTSLFANDNLLTSLPESMSALTVLAELSKFTSDPPLLMVHVSTALDLFLTEDWLWW